MFFRYLPCPKVGRKSQRLTIQIPMGQTPIGGTRDYGPEHWTGAQGRISLNLWSAEWQVLLRDNTGHNADRGHTPSPRINQSYSVLSKCRSFTAKSAFCTLPSSQSSFSHVHIVHSLELSSRLPFFLGHPSAGSYFLASGPVNFLSSSLSVTALFYLLPLFPAQMYFLFCLSILYAPSFSISTSQMLPVVFVHSVVLFKSLYHTTLHSTQRTSLVSSSVLFPRVYRKCFSTC